MGNTNQNTHRLRKLAFLIGLCGGIGGVSIDLDHVRIYIWHLRRKIEPEPANPIYNITEAGVGYRFSKAKVPASS